MRVPVLITACTLGAAALTLSGCATPTAPNRTAARQATAKPADGAEAAKDAKKSAKEKVICTNIYYEGSFIRNRKVCKTLAEWKKSHMKDLYQTRRAIQDFQDRALTRDTVSGQ